MKNFNRLLSNRVSKHKGEKYFCFNFFNHFSDEKNLLYHEDYCLKNEEVRVDIRPKGSFVFFKNFNRFMRHPVIFVVEFECLNVLISDAEPDSRKSFTNKTSKHVPCSFAYKIKFSDEVAEVLTKTEPCPALAMTSRVSTLLT